MPFYLNPKDMGNQYEIDCYFPVTNTEIQCEFAIRAFLFISDIF